MGAGRIRQKSTRGAGRQTSGERSALFPLPPSSQSAGIEHLSKKKKTA